MLRFLFQYGQQHAAMRQRSRRDGLSPGHNISGRKSEYKVCIAYVTHTVLATRESITEITPVYTAFLPREGIYLRNVFLEFVSNFYSMGRMTQANSAQTFYALSILFVVTI